MSSKPGRLEGKVCIVTGAAGGIGLETAILFAQNGALVLLADISADGLKAGGSKLAELVPGAKFKLFTCDVSKEDLVREMVAAVDEWGGVDVIFNNAGVMLDADGDAVSTSEATWDKTFNINVKGVWYGCKHAIESFRRHGKRSGSVINTASIVALVGSAAPQLAYTASKGAVLALTRELAMVHAREGFRFNSLCPAPLNTPLLQNFLGDDKAKRARREIHFPMGRFGEPIEQAHMVVFLASDESGFVTGQEMIVDGGMTRAYITAEGPATESPKNNANS